MTRDAEARYQVARARWLHQRLCRAVVAQRPTAQVLTLTYRLTRWLATAPRELAHEYYLRVAEDRAGALPPHRSEARAQLSREAGRRIIAVAREIEARETAERAAAEVDYDAD